MPSIERAVTLAFAGKLREAERIAGESSSPEASWLRAYLHNCFGRFDQALELAMDLAQGSADSDLAARSLITAASSLRQTGRHLPAHPLDESAMRLATTDATRAHALIGLAADAAGLGRESSEPIEQAAALAPPGDWRVRVRLAWVRCEQALVAGRARRAATNARDALDRSRAAGARRHEAKSLLFLAFSLREAGDHDWVADMKLAKSIAARIGAAPVAAVAAEALDAPRDGASPASQGR
ncbi:MAG TPA: hypothetical protein VM841_09895 [Actinomycetota bacterium]|nr:hypothetical protein [Actinomycetota bacterium]